MKKYICYIFFFFLFILNVCSNCYPLNDSSNIMYNITSGKIKDYKCSVDLGVNNCHLLIDDINPTGKWCPECKGYDCAGSPTFYFNLTNQQYINYFTVFLVNGTNSLRKYNVTFYLDGNEVYSQSFNEYYNDGNEIIPLYNCDWNNVYHKHNINLLVDSGKVDLVEHFSLDCTKNVLLSKFSLHYDKTYNNTLPIFIVNYNSTSLCINDTGENIDFNFDIVVTDKENDTIYYAINKYNYLRKKLDYLETFSYIDNNGKCKPKLSFFESNNFMSNGTYNKWSFINYILLYDFYIKGGYDDNGNCVGGMTISEYSEDFLINPDMLLNYDSEFWFKIKLPENNTRINFSFVDVNLVENIKLSLNLSSLGNLSFYIDNVIKFNIEFNNDEWIYFYADINKSGNISNFNIVSETINYNFNKTYSSNNIFGILFQTYNLYGSKNTDANIWYLRDVRIETTNFKIVPDFSIIKPTSFGFNKTGLHFLDVYVSDNVFQPYSFNTLTIPISISICDNSIKQGIEWTEDNEYIETANFFKNFLTSFCTNLDNSGLGNYGEYSAHDKISWCSLFNIFYGLFALIIAVVFYIMFFHNFILAWFVWSFVMMWGTIILEFSNLLKIIIGFCMVLSLVSMITSFILSKKGGGQYE